MLNHGIFCRHCKKMGEQREQGEQPHEYRCISVPPAKNDSGTGGTNHETVPPVPFAKNERGTEITASILAVPSVPLVPPKNISEMNQRTGLNQQRRILAMFTCAKIRNGSSYLGSHLTANGNNANEI